MEKAMITTQEAAQRLGVTEGRIRQICRGHKAPRKFGQKLARDWFLTESDLRAIAETVLRKSGKSFSN